MDFRLKELMVVVLPELDGQEMDTCCAASCSACTGCTKTRAPTPTISPDDADHPFSFVSQLRSQLKALETQV